MFLLSSKKNHLYCDQEFTVKSLFLIKLNIKQTALQYVTVLFFLLMLSLFKTIDKLKKEKDKKYKFTKYLSNILLHFSFTHFGMNGNMNKDDQNLRNILPFLLFVY